MTEREREIINEINEFKEGVRYYDEVLEKNPDDAYVQRHFKARKECCLKNIDELRKELKNERNSKK